MYGRVCVCVLSLSLLGARPHSQMVLALPLPWYVCVGVYFCDKVLRKLRDSLSFTLSLTHVCVFRGTTHGTTTGVISMRMTSCSLRMQ